MSIRDDLLAAVSQRYHISRGTREPEQDWKVRLLYTACGLMAYASLWDAQEEPVSLVHLRRRVQTNLEACQTIYPELMPSLPMAPKQLEDEIADLFLQAGMLYHSPSRIAPSMKREAAAGGILFQRGISADSISRVSGIGFYSTQPAGTPPAMDNVPAMFGLTQESLQSLWRHTVSAAVWRPLPSFAPGTEFLCTKPPFSPRAWVAEPESAASCSMLRTCNHGNDTPQYSLYRRMDSARAAAGSTAAYEVSPLPDWQVQSDQCLATLACACLSACGALPPIRFTEDGPLVHLRLDFPLPPRELALLKLYSWPEDCRNLPSSLERKLSAEAFAAVRLVLTGEGYPFEREN